MGQKITLGAGDSVYINGALITVSRRVEVDIEHPDGWRVKRLRRKRPAPETVVTRPHPKEACIPRRKAV